MNPAATDRRRKELAKIHLAKKQLGLDDELYRDLLWSVARVRSAKDLDAAGRQRLLDHFRARGWKPRRKGRTTPADDRAGLIAKLRAQAYEANVFQSYIDGMSKRMFGVERFEWCDPDQLRRLVAAMAYHIRRRGRHGARD